MRAVKRAWARLTSYFRKRDLDRDLDEELRSHLDLATDDYLRQGVPLPEARRRARAMLGSMEASKDSHRDARGFPWLEGLFYDLRFALRGLRRDRSFSITAIATLALAIGLNVTTFAVMDTMLFRGFPLVQANRRVVYMQERNSLGTCCGISYLDFEDWRQQASSFAGLAFETGKPVTFSDQAGETASDVMAATLSANSFSVLGVQPIVGRDFVPADEVPGAPPVVILNYHFWRDRFAKSPDIVGRTVWIDKAPATVIAVMPQGFDFPERQDFWMPLAHTPALEQRAPTGHLAFGRLADGATIESARAELETINRRLAAAYPATNRGVVPRVDTHAQFFTGPDAPIIYGSLWAAGWFVLLIACANLANLALARTLRRSRELSTRIALGAGQARMVRQIFTESLLLAAAGGGLAWWIASTSVRVWAAATESPYQILDYSFTVATPAYWGAICILAAVLLAAVPVARIRKLDVNGTLKGDTRGVTQGRGAKFLSGTLVAGQMALAIVLLAGAGVIVRSFVNVVRADLGVTAPDRVLTGLVRLPPDKYPTPESRLRFFDALKTRLTAIPGVESESVANSIPVNNPSEYRFEVETDAVREERRVITMIAGTDYFRAVGARVVAGRAFRDTDPSTGLPVAIVNQSFADTFWPGIDLLGKRLRLFAGGQPGEWRTVVGVSSNIMQGDAIRQRFLPLVYLPFRQAPLGSTWVLVRTQGPAEQVAAAVRAEVQASDPDLLLEDYSTLQATLGFRRDRMDLQHAEMGKNAALTPLFATIALLLAAIGLYAVVAHSVGQRTKEIGVRIAVGAAAEDIRRLVFREGMTPVAVGLLLGLAASLGVNRILESQLVGVSPYDPLTMAGALLVLIAVALAGCHLPARRAIRVDPVVALRHD